MKVMNKIMTSLSTCLQCLTSLLFKPSVFSSSQCCGNSRKPELVDHKWVNFNVLKPVNATKSKQKYFVHEIFHKSAQNGRVFPLRMIFFNLQYKDVSCIDLIINLQLSDQNCSAKNRFMLDVKEFAPCVDGNDNTAPRSSFNHYKH